tara:strand:- start:829 stop:2538 length:1710 start_codon:yes stop_codon:yes gene_type:complete
MKKKLILKESELVDFLTTTLLDVIKEQEFTADGDVYIKDPGIMGNPSVNYQLKKTGHEVANVSPETFVGYWWPKCARLKYGPVYSMQNSTDQANACFTHMPSTSTNYLTGRNRRRILELWIEKSKQIQNQIKTQLVPKMSSKYDQTNFNTKDRELYKKYEIWVNKFVAEKEDEWDADDWQILEYVADAIGIVGLFFGPVGWAVSTAAGLIGAFARVKLDNIGGAVVILALDIIPGFKLFKHLKNVKQFKRMDDAQIGTAFKYFEEPTEAAYKSLNLVEKELVDYTIKNPKIIKPLLKTSSDAKKIKNTITGIKNMQSFWKFSKTKNGIKYGLDKMGWKEFQVYQKGLSDAQKVFNGIKKGITTASPYVIGLIPGLYAISWLMYGANRVVFQNVISNTEDLITAKKLGNKWHYRYDRVLNQKYPYNTTLTKCDDYTGIFKNSILPGSPPDILLLVKVWRDTETYPPIKPKLESCMGVEMDEIVNPGGGWRPNLCCLENYNLNRQEGVLLKQQDDAIGLVDNIIQRLEAGEINDSQAKEEIGQTFNLEPAEYQKLEFPDNIADSLETYEIW